MLLASVSAIRQGLGYDAMTDITAAISESLHAVENALAGSLRCEFGQSNYVDVFYVETSLVGGAPRCDLRLRGAFVDEDTLVIERASYPDFSDAEDVTSSFMVKAESGFLADIMTVYDRHYVRATYTAGFGADSEDATSYDLSQVPGWLQEAAKLNALLLLSSHPTLKEAEVELDTDQYRDALSRIIQRHVRYAPHAQLPIN